MSRSDRLQDRIRRIIEYGSVWQRMALVAAVMVVASPLPAMAVIAAGYSPLMALSCTTLVGIFVTATTGLNLLIWER